MADDILKNIPLPADLPENWTSGQIVAPTGAEAGLDDQHGYNYLMRQVNNAQKALKALAAQREEDLARIKFWASDDPTSPASFIGGTWERIEGKFIMGASDTYPAGSTGGSATHSHQYGAMVTTFYGQVAGSDTDAMRLANYNRQNIISYISMVYAGTELSANVNSGTSTEMVERTVTKLSNEASTSYTSSLPPYYCMYIWRRIA
nr:MAG TPA: baseplate protein [Caudoviricetes sp.]